MAIVVQVWFLATNFMSALTWKTRNLMWMLSILRSRLVVDRYIVFWRFRSVLSSFSCTTQDLHLPMSSCEGDGDENAPTSRPADLIWQTTLDTQHTRPLFLMWIPELSYWHCRFREDCCRKRVPNTFRCWCTGEGRLEIWPQERGQDCETRIRASQVYWRDNY